MLRVLLLSTVFILSVSGRPAFATSILFQQSPSSGPLRNSTHDPGVPTSGFATFDNFVLTTDAAIESVTFYGAYWDFVNRANNPILPNTDSWRVSFRTDESSLPGTTLLEELHAAAGPSVATTFLGFGSFTTGGQTDTIRYYRFTIDLMSPLSLQAGVPYWFGALSEVNPYDGQIFAWSPSAQADLAAQLFFATGAYTPVRDVAFELNGTPVPEPGSFILLASGLAAASRFRRRNPQGRRR